MNGYMINEMPYRSNVVHADCDPVLCDWGKSGFRTVASSLKVVAEETRRQRCSTIVPFNVVYADGDPVLGYWSV